jgi:lipopolysaccharide transport system permease protein
MLTKIYFPRMIVPASTVIVNFIDFLISFVLFIGLMLWYHYVPAWAILMLPLLFLWVVLVSIGTGFYVAAVNVKYRDFKYIVPFVVQFGLYISPVGFSSNVIPEKWRLLYSVNPMVGVIDGFRWAITGDTRFIYLPGFLLSIAITFAFLLFGTIYFRKMERVFADLV